MRDRNRQTPLQHIVLQGLHASELLHELVLHKADPNTPIGRNASTPLHEAVLRGSLEFLQTVVQAKACVHMCNREGHTPLHLALSESIGIGKKAAQVRFKIIQMLLCADGMNAGLAKSIGKMAGVAPNSERRMWLASDDLLSTLVRQ